MESTESLTVDWLSIGKPDIDGVIVTDSVRVDSMTIVAVVPSGMMSLSAKISTWFVCA